MKYLSSYAIGAVVLLCVVVFFVLTMYDRNKSQQIATLYETQLAACNAYPNNSIQNIIQTSRLTIYLPRNLYPNQNNLLSFTTASGTASAGWISNAGPIAQSYGATINCFAYYYEFNGSGEVNLTSTSSIAGVPEYIVHFMVSQINITPNTTPPPNKLPVESGKGTIAGMVLLGPLCPVERIPPNPQCADKPYQTNLILTTSNGTQMIETFSSNINGKFSVQVPPGVYAIRSAPSINFYPRCSTNNAVSVSAGAYASSTVYCDTGIR